MKFLQSILHFLWTARLMCLDLRPSHTQALANLSVSELEGVRNLSGFFTGIMKRVRADAGLPDYSAPKRDDSDSDSDSESESDSKSGSESESEGSESESEESEEENKSDSKEEDEESKQVAEEDEGMDDENGDSSGSDSGSDDENGCEVVEVRASNVESEIESEDDDTDNEDDGDAKKADTKAGSDDEDSDDEKDDGGLDKLISSANGAAAERSTNGGAKQVLRWLACLYSVSDLQPQHAFRFSSFVVSAQHL